MIVVGTHVDDVKGQSAAEKLEKMRVAYKRRFPTYAPIRYFAVSCVSDEGISELRVALQDLISKQSHLGEMYPRSYILMEKLLETERAKRAQVPVMSAKKSTETASCYFCNLLGTGRAQLLALGSMCGLDTPSAVLECARLLALLGSFSLLAWLNDRYTMYLICSQDRLFTLIVTHI